MSLLSRSGWLILDKPSGLSSNHALQQARRCFGCPPVKAGHAGTLDPLASGVLPIALGEATKALPYVLTADKDYAFTVQWGIATDTLDSDGQVTQRSEIIPDAAAIEAALPGFTGVISQVPPAYSALKVDGKRAYALARAGETPALAARPVTVRSLALTGYDSSGYSTFALSCGKGTYVRSLARDLAETLGACATVTKLRRTRAGCFSLPQAITLDALKAATYPCHRLLPLSFALDDILALAVTEAQVAAVRQGKRLTGLAASSSETPQAAYVYRHEEVIAIGALSPQGDFAPRRVLHPS